MIRTSRDGYWAVGITLRWSEHTGSINGKPHSGWQAHVAYFDDGFNDDDPDTGQVSTEGVLRTRYGVRDGDLVTGLRAVIDVVLADAVRLGITFKDPALYYDNDGGSKDWPPPAGWIELLTAEADRLGWTCPYRPQKAMP